MYLNEHTLTWVLVCNAFGVLGAVVGFVAFFLAYRSIRRRHAKAMQELHDLSDDIAHDLRTPLARMHAQAELAAMGEVSAQELAAGVAEETTSMLELINTMLDLSQTGARIERSPRTDVDLAAIVRQMTEFYASVAEDKGVAFVLDLPDGEIVRSAHKAKLQQLVGNLLDNAVKFTPSGGTVSVTLQSRNGVKKLAIPPSAVMQDMHGSCVWVVKKDRTVERRYVVRDVTEGDVQFVASGLKVGETVVADGVHKVTKHSIIEPVK